MEASTSRVWCLEVLRSRTGAFRSVIFLIRHFSAWSGGCQKHESLVKVWFRASCLLTFWLSEEIVAKVTIFNFSFVKLFFLSPCFILNDKSPISFASSSKGCNDTDVTLFVSLGGDCAKDPEDFSTSFNNILNKWMWWEERWPGTVSWKVQNM